MKGQRAFRNLGVSMLIKKMTMIVAVAFISLNGAMVFASHNNNTSDDNSFSDVEAIRLAISKKVVVLVI